MTASYSLTLDARVKIYGFYKKTLLGETAKYPIDIDDLTEFTNGTDSDEVNMPYVDQRTLTSGETDSLDLSGSLTGFYGRTVTLTNIKLLYVFNEGILDGDGNPVATTGQKLWVGGAAANAWKGPFETQADKLEVPSGGKLFLEDPFEGWIVIPGAQDILDVEYDGSAASGGTLQYTIFIAGDQ